MNKLESLAGTFSEHDVKCCASVRVRSQRNQNWPQTGNLPANPTSMIQMQQVINHNADQFVLGRRHTATVHLG